MAFSLTEDIRSVTELKRETRELLEQIHQTGRPIVVTVNGKADVVLLDVKSYEKHLQALNLASLLAEGEKDVSSGKTRPMHSFLSEFKHARKI